VLAERRHRQLLLDLRLADERAAAAPPDEVALADEVVERCPDGQPRDAELRAELALRRDRLSDREPVHEAEDAVARLALLRDAAQVVSASRVADWAEPLAMPAASYRPERQVVNTSLRPRPRSPPDRRGSGGGTRRRARRPRRAGPWPRRARRWGR